jgi:hypothetical protein
VLLLLKSGSTTELEADGISDNLAGISWLAWLTPATAE